MAFYSNQIEYKGTLLDISFVPKYPINEIRKSQYAFDSETLNDLIINCRSHSCDELSNFDSFGYRDALDVKITDTILAVHKSFFRVFPFKDGHWIDYKTGKIKMIPVLFTKDTYHSSLILDIDLMLQVIDKGALAEECSLEHTLHELVSYASYCTLEQQAMCLIVLRKMVGNYLVLNNFIIELPFLNEVMTMLKNYCANNVCSKFKKSLGIKAINLMFPIESVFLIQNNRATITEYSNMIKSIASTALSSLHCSYLCSNYYLPETMYASVYKTLKEAKFLYAFFTLCLQENNKTMYREYRSKLEPIWVTSNKLNQTEEVLFHRYPSNGHNPIPYDNNFSAILNNRCSVIRPQDVNTVMLGQSPSKKYIKKFEFVNSQLNDLVYTGSTELTVRQRWLLVAHIVNSSIKE